MKERRRLGKTCQPVWLRGGNERFDYFFFFMSAIVFKCNDEDHLQVT